MNREIFYTYATTLERLADLLSHGAVVKMHSDRLDGHWVGIIEWKIY